MGKHIARACFLNYNEGKEVRDMGRSHEIRISEQEQQYLKWNLDRMRESFVGKPIEGKKFHLIRRYLDDRKDDFPKQVEENFPVLYKALKELPSGKCLYNQIYGGDGVTLATVEQLAVFCTKVFHFDHAVTAEELTTKDLSPFPSMRKVSGLWGRYEGIYRCFYLDQESDGKDLYGAILQLKEVDAKLQCRMVMGIRKDRYFDKLEKMLKDEKLAVVSELDRMNLKDDNDRTQLYYYEGTMDDRSFPEYYLIKMIRDQSNHSMALFLRNWSRSKKLQYSGGIAMAVRCRKEEILTYSMLLTREPFSLIGEKEFLLKHLAGTMQQNGLKESKDMDESLDREGRKHSKTRK